eukprot:CAMPEP_0184970612 /NCGR_PEP_ID=MMETSP1098-20130426/3024_1 /TAXON_ID=89044 /ORGANISM="Spumella elongata, Strain CCAP 955/1" /LENGTH=308 /DNA_ID=CAMNT_0027492565 /DNA_START=121 /DNA_END=1047 /DNA_ORIENTATION=+
MGLYVSIDQHKVPQEWMEMFACMKLTRTEVKKLHVIFDKTDEKKIGGINIVQWLTLFDLERNSFTERIFSAFDKDGNKHIDFYEFVISLWKFCSLGEGAINVFAFDLYDRDSDGVLTSKEATTLFKELLGQAFDHSGNKSSLYTLLEKSSDCSVTVENFKEFTRTHQALLHQVFTVQKRMRDVTLGSSTFQAMADRRIELRKGYHITISSLMVLHSDRILFKSMMEDRSIMRMTSKMKLVLDNTDNSSHYRSADGANKSPESTVNLSHKVTARMAWKEPTSQSSKRAKRKVLPNNPLPSDLLHYHNFP